MKMCGFVSPTRDVGVEDNNSGVPLEVTKLVHPFIHVINGFAH